MLNDCTVSFCAALFDANSLYYTLSTIAQTLATAFGILGAFVFFRVAMWRDVVSKADEWISGMWGNRGLPVEELQQTLKNAGLEGLRSKMAELRQEGTFGSDIEGQANSTRKALLVAAHGASRRMKSVLLVLQWALWLTSVSVFISIGGLPAVPWLLSIKHSCLDISLGVLLLLTFVCLVLYVYLIGNSLKTDV